MSSNKYTSRFRGLINQNNVSVGDHAHGTISYLDQLNDEQLKDVYDELRKIFSDGKSVGFKIVGEDNFGPKNDISVYLLQMLDEDREKALISFHRKYGKTYNGIYTDVPVWHISKRNIVGEIRVGDIVMAHSVDIKKLGPHDPVYKIHLSN